MNDPTELLRGAIPVRKRDTTVDVRFAACAGVCETLEGPVRYGRGDAILTGAHEDRWPVSAHYLHAYYHAVDGTVPGGDGIYRRYPRSVRAVQLTAALAVPGGPRNDPLKGMKGDWLVDYGDGSVGIVRESIFAATYDRE